MKSEEWHGSPLQTSTTLPPGCRKSEICVRASGVCRGSSCGSRLIGGESLSTGAVLVVGGSSVCPGPLSQITHVEPLYGNFGTAGTL